jgi:hypothetical protein
MAIKSRTLVIGDIHMTVIISNFNISSLGALSTFSDNRNIFT